MSDTLKVLLAIYSFILIVNSISTYVLWKQTQEDLFFDVLLIWLSCLTNFVLQGVFQNFDLKMLLAYSTYFATSYFILKFIQNITLDQSEKTLKFRRITLFGSSFLILLGYALQLSFNNYFVSSLTIAIGISLPMLLGCYFIFQLKAKNNTGLTSLAVIIFLNAIHFLDYPFLRTLALGSLIGFTIALLILFSLSMFIPAFVVNKLNQNYAVRLEKEVELKTNELAHLVHDKRALLSVVCHDIANPLQILKVATEKLNTSISANDIETSKKQIEKVFHLVNLILSLFKKVRDLQSARDGKNNLVIEPVDIHTLIQEVALLFEEPLLQKEIKLELFDRSSRSLAYADSAILKNQILANLLSNAIKFSNNNSTIKISVLEKNKTIVIRVEDHGIGIPPDLLKNIFSFEHKTTRDGTNNEKGTGLGLPVLKTYLDLMNGEIRVTSAAESSLHERIGSAFEIELPKVSES